MKVIIPFETIAVATDIFGLLRDKHTNRDSSDDSILSLLEDMKYIIFLLRFHPCETRT